MNYLKSILLLGIISMMLFNQYGNAQPYFSHSYDLIKNEELLNDQFLRSSVSTDQGTYFYQEKSTIKAGNILTSEIGITLVDSSEVKWQRIFKSSNGSLSTYKIFDGITSTDKGVAFIANVLDDSNKYKYAVISIDSLGNEISRFIYSSDSLRAVRAIDRGPSGNLYITGFEFFDTSVDSKKWSVFLSIIDEEGNELFHKNYNPREFSNQIGYNIAIECDQKNGDVYITNSSGSAGRKAWVLRLDSIGNKKWFFSTDEYQSFDPQQSIPKITIDNKRQNLYLSWFSENKNLNKPLPYFGTPSNLIAIDSTGSALWSRDFEADYKTIVTDINITDSGDILVCGFDSDRNDGSIDYGWLARINELGEVLWQKYILETGNRADETGGMSFAEVHELKDGSILLGGNIIDTVGRGEFNRNAWIVRLDSAGNCYGNDCPEIYSSNEITSIGSSTIKNERMNIFPNPADTKFHLEFNNNYTGRITIINMAGMITDIKYIDNQRHLTFNCRNFDSGVYTVLFRNKYKHQLIQSKVLIQ